MLDFLYVSPEERFCLFCSFLFFFCFFCPLRHILFFFFFFNDPAPTEISPLPLHDALPISDPPHGLQPLVRDRVVDGDPARDGGDRRGVDAVQVAVGTVRLEQPLDVDPPALRSEEHTSELQSPCNLVCRLLLEKKKKERRHQYIDQKNSIRNRIVLIELNILPLLCHIVACACTAAVHWV